MKELILLHSCVTPHEIKMIFYGCVQKQSLAAATLMKMPLEQAELGNEKPLNGASSRVQLTGLSLIRAPTGAGRAVGDPGVPGMKPWPSPLIRAIPLLVF